MRFYNTFARSNNNFVTQEWSADEMFSFEFIKYCIYGVLLSFISAIASAVCLIARLWDYDEDEKVPSFVGIITALYFLIDYSRGWIVTWILAIVEDAATIKTMAVWNLAMLITHILVLIFGDTIYFNVENEASRKPTLVCCVIFIIVIAYNVSNLLIN